MYTTANTHLSQTMQIRASDARDSQWRRHEQEHSTGSGWVGGGSEPTGDRPGITRHGHNLKISARVQEIKVALNEQGRELFAGGTLGHGEIQPHDLVVQGALLDHLLLVVEDVVKISQEVLQLQSEKRARRL